MLSSGYVLLICNIPDISWVRRDVAESSLTRPTLGLFSKLELKLCWVWSFGALISIPLLTLPGLWQRPIM